MWRLWIDTGGTFTDCLARDPAGELRRVKVLSSSGLRGSVVRRLDAATLCVDLGLGAETRLPEGFLCGGRLRRLGSAKDLDEDADEGAEEGAEEGADRGVSLRGSSRAGQGEAVEVTAPAHGLSAGDPVEILFDEEPPILAARLVTGSASAEELPELELRLATTRGTNALLERRGARTVFLVTRGFADLLRIGDQRRPDLFALRVDRPEPLYERVIEVDERLAADGTVVTPLDLEALRPQIEGLRADGLESAAVALLHSYLDAEGEDGHERRVAEALGEAGFDHVSRSAELSPSIKILPRAQTAVVDAYLAPVVGRYLRRVRQALGNASAGDAGDAGDARDARDRHRVRVMTSAGGLSSARGFRAKDSLLSGPAGGVVGAARVGRELGLRRLVAFDMGGTSTDVSRFDGDFEYRYEQTVGDAQIAAPALAIETVAAGGGSICGLDGRRLTVGPESAGADPGPACYGAGGPLTLTDVNLLLGRLDPDRFGLPVDVAAAEAARDAVLARLESAGSEMAPDDLLRGYLEVADLRMAGAVRRISVRQGYDPRNYALVAFGGAGGQHACAVAEELGLGTVVLPREAGLLSALGLGSARLERFAQRQILEPLERLDDLADRFAAVAEEALSELADEGVAAEDAEVRRRIAFLRFLGQDATLEIDLGSAGGPAGGPEGSEQDLTGRLARAFLERYEERFGYRPEDRALEVESLRVVASTREEASADGIEEPPEIGEDAWDDLPSAESVGRRRAAFDAWHEVPVYELAGLASGARIDGPALIFDAHASLTLAPGWRAVKAAVGSLVARRAKSSGRDG